MVFDFLKGEFIDVISWLDDTRDTMVWRFDRRGQAIKMGAKLTVREGQAAVFIHEGQLADVFTPGLYQLETNNMPILTTLQHWDHGFQSPFKSEVYFVSTTRFNDQKWGTKNPIMARDPEFGPVRIRAFGTYSLRVSDPGKFMTEIVGTDGEFTTDEVTNQIRNQIVQSASQALAASGIPVLDMAANLEDLGKVIANAITPRVAEYGLSIPEFYIENISLPEEVEKAMDKRSSIGVVGDLNKYMQFNAAEAMNQPGGAMGGAMGAGMGFGMGAGMAQNMGPWGAAQPPAAPTAAAPPPPPPPPMGKQWHLADNGATLGPFADADLRRLAGEGKLSRATMVWTQGQNGWKMASETEIAALLDSLPPPLPKP